MNRQRLARAGWVIAVALIASKDSYAQPYLVRNINDTESGSGRDSSPLVLGVADGYVIFAADDLEHGNEPWTTDGTAAGTRLLADTSPESAFSFGASRFAAVGGRLLFELGHLFSTDGTPEGTVRLAFETLGPRGYIDRTVVGTVGEPPRLLFSQSRSATDDLWITDGTPEGTRLVAELNPLSGPGASLGDDMVLVSGFSELWRSDGSRAGTVPVRSFSTIDGLVALGEGRAVLVADDGVAGSELWVTDGTPAGTRLVEDLRPGPDGPSPTLLGADREAGRAFFLLSDPSVGVDIWRTDGTGGGTFALISGIDLGFISPLVVGGLLFADVNDGVHGVELLASDGTPAGTRVLDLCPGSCSSFPDSVTATSIGVLVTASDAQGRRSWLTDGTVAGTRRLVDLCPGSCGSNATLLLDLGGEIVFQSSDDVSWVSDGTAAGTRPLPLPAGLNIQSSLGVGVVDGVAVFAASDDLHGSEPWRTDGTATGTFRLGDLAEGSDQGSDPAHFEEFAGEAFFAASVGLPGPPSTRGLWRTDGTEAGTRPFTALDSDGNVIDLLTFGSDLFVLTRHDLQTEVWRTDGTPAGTLQVFADEFPGTSACCDAGFAAVGGQLYVFGPGLWRTGRRAGSALKIADLTFSEETSEQGPGLLDGRLYFSATDRVTGARDFELWSSDGTLGGTRRVRDIRPGSAPSNPREFTALAEQLFFIADHDSVRQSMWRTDGTEAGTEMLLEVDSRLGGRILGAVGGRVVVFDGDVLWATDGTDFIELGNVFGEMGSITRAAAVSLGGRIFFIAGFLSPGVPDSRLWSTDGTPIGTRPVAGGAPLGHGVLNLFRAGDELVLLVQNPLFGLELWVTDRTPAGRRRIASLEGLEVDEFGLFGDGAPPIALGDRLLFAAETPGIGRELWAVDLDARLPPFGPPQAPRGLRAEAWSESSVRLSWRDESEHETSFLIAGTTADESLAGTVSVPAGTDAAIVQGLPPETPFTFTVAAVNEMGTSAPSNEASGTPLPGDAGPCLADAGTLCLAGGRFAVSVLWRDQHNGGVGTGGALPLAGSERTGSFWFFDPANVELIFKVLDGRGINGSFWSFYGAVSEVEYWVTAVDTRRRRSRTYHNRPGEICGLGDTAAFPEVSPVSGEASTTRSGDAADAAVVTWPYTAEAARDPSDRWRPLSLPAGDGPTSRAAVGTAGGSCTPGPETLCLLGGRLRVEVDWHDQHNGGSGAGRAVPGTDKSGFFWFFNADNLELVVKALDGTTVNGRLWVFYGALTDVEYTITVTDTLTGASVPYHNPPGEICGGADTGAF